MSNTTSTFPTGTLMQGKRGLIIGVANDRSLSWAIAQACHAQGAELAFTYQGEALEKRVRPLAQSIGSDFMVPCDVTDEASMDATFAALRDKWGTIDFVVHGIAFSDKNELDGRYVNTTRANFLKTMDISCFSFTSVCQRAAAMMPSKEQGGGSLITLSYLGAVRVMPHYNVMGVAKAALEASVLYLASDLGMDGIRVNGLSAGPVKTLAAMGIGDFNQILKWNKLNSPLRRNVTQEEVGKAGMYLLSDLASGVTGEMHYVDCGYNGTGMLAVDKVGETAEMLTEFAATQQKTSGAA